MLFTIIFKAEIDQSAAKTSFFITRHFYLFLFIWLNSAPNSSLGALEVLYIIINIMIIIL